MRAKEFLSEMGFAGIPDYKTMPAYKLKKASKGKHKFFCLQTRLFPQVYQH